MRPAEGLSPIQHSEFEIFTGADVRFGSKADIAVQKSMSALPPKADIGTQSRDVRFVPKADI
jgi:hypothetical protein